MTFPFETKLAVGVVRKVNSSKVFVNFVKVDVLPEPIGNSGCQIDLVVVVALEFRFENGGGFLGDRSRDKLRRDRFHELYY